MTRMSGGRLIADYLVEEQVPYVFGVAGHGNIGLLNALYDVRSDLPALLVHHEQVAGHMADAFFRVAHRPVATFTSTGPGSANMPMSLATALTDSSAFLAITSNVPTSQFNRGPFQELNRHHQAEGSQALRPFTKRVFAPTRVEMLPLALRQAFKTMLTGRPGPVNLDVPFNLYLEEEDVEVPDPAAWRKGISSRVGASPSDIECVVDLLLGAERPLILVGNGVVISEGSEKVRELAELIDVPVTHSPNAKGVLATTGRYSVGGVGRNGTLAANQAALNADVLLAIGTHFDDRMSSSWVPGYTFNIPPTQLIHVDIDVDEIGRNYPVRLGIQADARTFVDQLLAAIRPRISEARNRIPWWERIDGWRSEWRKATESQSFSDAVPIRPERLIREMRNSIPRDAIVLPDSGAHHNWLVEFWDTDVPGSLVQTCGFASMGFAVCGVLGAALAAPDRRAIAVVGDGGMLMTPQAIPTAVEYQIPVVWIVWNNLGYGAIRDLQKGIWGREYVTSFLRADSSQPYCADLSAMARAYGAGGIRVERPGEVGEAIREALAAESPYVVEVMIDPVAKMPSTGTWELPPLAPFMPTVVPPSSSGS